MTIYFSVLVGVLLNKCECMNKNFKKNIFSNIVERSCSVGCAHVPALERAHKDPSAGRVRSR